MRGKGDRPSGAVRKPPGFEGRLPAAAKIANGADGAAPSTPQSNGVPDSPQLVATRPKSSRGTYATEPPGAAASGVFSRIARAPPEHVIY